MLASRVVVAAAIAPASLIRAGRSSARRVAMASSSTHSTSTTIKLSSGTEIPTVGLGTWQAARGVVGRAVSDALRLGYTHIDCAAAYANEEEVGEALTTAFEAKTITRDEVFITSKLWNDRRKANDVRDGCLQSLQDLNLSHLDLYLIHWPVVWKRGTLMQPDNSASIAECWRAMEQLVEDGLVKAIGVSNFTEKELRELLKTAKIKPAVNQIEVHPRLPQDELVAYCQRNDICITAYSPLARGGGVLDHPSVVEVSSKKNISPAQVALRWNVERGIVVIPKSVTPSRIESNADLFSFEFGDDDFEKIKQLDDGVSTSTSPWSDSGPTASRNKWLKPLLEIVLWPVFKVIKIDVQKMGRKGFLKFAWMK
jgi:diketogulonate reductase-like aldo/keto reductase|tara:strand:+ start:26485 stop:27591 length:1107 start_codon:yes stop_codon:yes gene_type:complete